MTYTYILQMIAIGSIPVVIIAGVIAFIWMAATYYRWEASDIKVWVGIISFVVIGVIVVGFLLFSIGQFLTVGYIGPHP